LAGIGAPKVRELLSGRQILTLAGRFSGPISAVALTPDGQRAVSACYDRTLKIWDLESGVKLRDLTGHTSLVYGVAVTPDGKRAVSASKDKTVKVWDLGLAKVLATFTCDSAAFCCGYSDALKLFVAGDDDGHVHFLRLEEPKAKG
jgi:WD40 repeat protein